VYIVTIWPLRRGVSKQHLPSPALAFDVRPVVLFERSMKTNILVGNTQEWLNNLLEALGAPQVQLSPDHQDCSHQCRLAQPVSRRRNAELQPVVVALLGEHTAGDGGSLGIQGARPGAVLE
jgi:hypothetical protein